MECPHCHAKIMWSERFINLIGDRIKHLESFEGLHCLCGQIVDPVILFNRHNQPETRKTRPFHWMGEEVM